MKIVKKIAVIIVLLFNGFTIHYLISFGRGTSDLVLLPLIVLAFLIAGFLLKVLDQKLIPGGLIFLAASVGLFGLGYMLNSDSSPIPHIKQGLISLLAFLIGYSFKPDRLRTYFLRMLGFGIVFAVFLFFINPRLLYQTQFAFKENKSLDNSHLQYAFKNSSGETITSASLAGKVVILEFWFIGCTPCYQKMNDMEVLAKKYRDKNVAFLMVNAGSVRDTYEDFLKEIKKFPPELTWVYDSASLHTEKMKVRGFPTEIMIDKNGKVRHQFIGYNDDVALVYKKETIKKIDALLNEKK